MQARPVRAERAQGQPYQHHVPAVARRDRPHQAPIGQASQREDKQEHHLPADALPVHQHGRQHAPDGDVVEAGIAQDALAQRRAQDLEFLHQQDQDRQRGDRAGHADPDHELPGPPVQAQPAVELQHAQPHPGTQQQRHAQRQCGRGTGIATVRPRGPDVQLDPGDHHEQHHRPPRNAVQRHDHVGVEDRAVVIREGVTEQPRPQQHAGDDLHNHQRREVVQPPEAPDGVRHQEDDRHRDQEQLGGGDGVRHRRRSGQAAPWPVP